MHKITVENKSRLDHRENKKTFDELCVSAETHTHCNLSQHATGMHMFQTSLFTSTVM